MSNRDSLGVGELLPQDVIHVFAQEKHSKRGRKKRPRSLGRAFNWFKRKKRKTNGQNHGMGPALDLALDGHRAGHHGRHKGGQKAGRQNHQHGNSQAVPKVDDDDDKTPAPPQFQENVFVESSRSKYVEDLHTEALEGLKMMQQEEEGQIPNDGVEYPDNESVVSTVTVQTDGESGGFVTDSTIADSSSIVSRQSSVSARSSRSGLTRQASTFRPLNSGKKSEKTKTRRRHRRTVAGIPRHVQKELGLDRAAWMTNQRLDEEQFYNGDNSPVTGRPEQEAGSPEEPGVSPQAANIIHPLSKEKVAQLNAAHAAHRDDLALLRLNPHPGDERRPRSLAVPWMTTASSLQQDPASPVMTMSPQAAYMSKIIPNAVLPPSVDVVEISRNRSRSSVRTVSKSSLLLSSPAPSRASSRASSSRSMSSNITSASRYNGPNMSDASCWSTSESSDTLVSDSSTISSSSTPRQKMPHVNNSAKDNKVNGAFHTKVLKREEKDGQLGRSLSVMKAKRAPPPPSRSYSLHNKVKLRTRDLAEVGVESSSMGQEMESKNSGSSPVPSTCVDSPGYHGDTSSLDDSTGSTSFTFKKSQLQAPKMEDSIKNAAIDCKEASEEKQGQFQVSKQSKVLSPSSGYSSQDGTSPQQPPRVSPKHKAGFLTKLQKLFSGSTSASLAPSLPTQPEVAEKANSTCEPKHNTVSSSASVQTLKELFNIPPPPKVHAPPPPPPEVWAHNKRTFELLLGPPAPENTYAIIKKNPKDRRQQRQSPSASREGSVKGFVVERKHKNTAVTVEPVNESLVAKKVPESGDLNAEVHKENRCGDSKGDCKEEKVRVSDILNGMLVKAVEKRQERLAVTTEEKGQKASSQATEGMTNPGTLTTISITKMSSSSSPPPVDGPLQPTMQTTEASTSVQVVSPESSWPPPPPPMAQVSINGADALEFPLPPPPLFGEETMPLSPGIPPPPPYIAPSRPTAQIEKASLLPKESSVSSSPVKEVPHLLPNVTVSSPPPKDFTLNAQETSQSAEKAAPLNKLAAPQSIPPAPPLPTQLQPSEQETDHPDIPPKPDNNDLPNSILIPQQTIPSPPPLEPLLKPSTEDSGGDEAPILPPSEFRNTPSLNEAEKLAPTPPIGIPLPPPLPAQLPASSNYKSGVLSTENEKQAPVCASDVGREQTAITPSLLKMVKLRSVDNSPEPPEVQDQASAKGVHEEPPTIVTSSLLQMVKLRSVNNSPEPPEASTGVKEEASPSFLQMVKLRSINNSPEPAEVTKDANEESVSKATPSSPQTVKLQPVNDSTQPPEAKEQPKPKAPVSQQLPDKELPTSSSSSEAPQKPIRKSLIMTTPPSTSPPATITSQPTLPQSQSVVVPATTLQTVVSPMKKSPPSTTSSGSMNLQEAIRLRTAARSKEGRASLLSPLSPQDYRKSPTSTASFIFSKSNRKSAIETKQKQEEKENVQNNAEDFAKTMVTSEGEPKTGGKVPPPVAKKPKSKGKEAETTDAVEQTAGQEAQQDGLKDATEEMNGTAGTV
uniref:KIAA1522 n=1 Tax=Fundulus heteroclitus TaxID=8078 RepID=A0A3Q2PSM9_FUNHE